MHEPQIKVFRGLPPSIGPRKTASKAQTPVQDKLQGVKNRVLLVEDEPKSSALLVKSFEEAGFDADIVTAISQARAMLVTGSYLALVIRLNLPSQQYLAMVTRHKARSPSPPLSLFGSRREQLATEALIAYLKKITRLTPPSNRVVLRLGNLDLILDHHGSHVLIEGMPHNISQTDLAILELLLRRQGRAISKDSIGDYLKKGGPEITRNAIEVYIHRLRRLLGGLGAKVIIETVKGVGYLIKERDDVTSQADHPRAS